MNFRSGLYAASMTFVAIPAWAQNTATPPFTEEQMLRCITAYDNRGSEAGLSPQERVVVDKIGCGRYVDVEHPVTYHTCGFYRESSKDMAGYREWVAVQAPAILDATQKGPIPFVSEWTGNLQWIANGREVYVDVIVSKTGGGLDLSPTLPLSLVQRDKTAAIFRAALSFCFPAGS